MTTGFQDIIVKSLPVLKKAGVIRSSLFGSRVRGNADPDSDYDFLVEFPQGKSLFDLIDLQLQLELVLGGKVDVVTYRSVNPRLKPYIEQFECQIL
ncbi:MAG: nucleotidyltransferase family protein [bacterium]